MQGHGVIINLSTGLPYTFPFNPIELSSDKAINYYEAPNIGGSSHKRFFIGFGNKTINFSLEIMNKVKPLGITSDIAFFDALRNPAPGLLGIAGSFFGNDNYPPPQVMYNWGTGILLPLIWDVDDIKIKGKLFHQDPARGVVGIPWKATVDISLSLDEDNDLFKASQIAQKVAEVSASVESIAIDVRSAISGGRRER